MGLGNDEWCGGEVERRGGRWGEGVMKGWVERCTGEEWEGIRS